MRKFHILTIDSTREDLLSIEDYQFRDLNLTKFWSAGKIDDQDCKALMLYTDDADTKNTDAVGNPLSLFIFSERLVEMLHPFIKDDTQFLKIVLTKQSTKERISKFGILHPFRSIECVDIDHSGVSYSNDNELSLIGDIVIEADKVPNDIHIFRAAEDNNTVFVSDDLAQSLVGKGINGIAFIRCKSV